MTQYVRAALTGLVARLRAATDDQAGFAPLTLVLGVGLVIVPVLLLVLTIPTWLERSVDAHDAAANAVRTLATANNWQAGTLAANQTVSQLISNDGLDPGLVSVTYAGDLNPGDTVTARVTVTIPAGVIPGIGTYGTVHYTATSTQHIDTYKAENNG